MNSDCFYDCLKTAGEHGKSKIKMQEKPLIKQQKSNKKSCIHARIRRLYFINIDISHNSTTKDNCKCSNNFSYIFCHFYCSSNFKETLHIANKTSQISDKCIKRRLKASVLSTIIFQMKTLRLNHLYEQKFFVGKRNRKKDV